MAAHRLNIFWIFFLGFSAFLEAQNLDTIAKRLSDLTFSHNPKAQYIVDSLSSNKQALKHKAYQHTLGNYYFLSGNYDSAFSAYSRAMVFAQQDSDSARVLALNNNIGVALMEMGRISEAIQYLTETLDRRKDLLDTARILSGYGNLIEAYQILEAKDRVLNLLKESFQWRVDSIQYAYPLRRLHVLASFHFYKYGDYKESLVHLKAMRSLDEYLKDDRFKAEYLLSLGRVNLKLGRNEEGVRALRESILLFKKTDFPGGLTGAYLELANYHQSLEELDTAKSYLQRALVNASAPDMKLSIYQGLLAIYKSVGAYEIALQIQDSISVLKTQLQGIEVQKAVFDIESKYQLKEKQNQIKSLSNEARIAKLEAEQLDLKSRRLNTWLWTGAALALVLILFLLGQYRNIRLQKEQAALKADLRSKQNHLEKQALQVQLFRSQINPHFFFNTLYAIQSFVLSNKALESSKYLSKFAALMRAVLELNDQEFISIEREIQVVKDYLNLEKLRFEEKFKFQINCPETLMPASIPTMILQPFVENAIVHGFRDYNEGGLLEVNFTEYSENEILIEIKDNGKGYKPNNSDKSSKKSMALDLVGKRLRILSEEKGKAFQFKILNRKEVEAISGTIVQLQIPRNSAD